MLPLELLLDVIEDDDSMRCTASVSEQQVAAIDEGELAHTWFSQFLGRSVRCLKVDPEEAQTIEGPAQALGDPAAHMSNQVDRVNVLWRLGRQMYDCTV